MNLIKSISGALRFIGVDQKSFWVGAVLASVITVFAINPKDNSVEVMSGCLGTLAALEYRIKTDGRKGPDGSICVQGLDKLADRLVERVYER